MSTYRAILPGKSEEFFTTLRHPAFGIAPLSKVPTWQVLISNRRSRVTGPDDDPRRGALPGPSKYPPL
eukprot:345794-Hanusia_phi.AAC.2